MSQDKDFMDFVKEAADTNVEGQKPWVREFLEMLCEPNKTAGDLCNFLQLKGYNGVRIKDCQTALDVSRKIPGAGLPRWRKHIKDLEQQDY